MNRMWQRILGAAAPARKGQATRDEVSVTGKDRQLIGESSTRTGAGAARAGRVR